MSEGERKTAASGEAEKKKFLSCVQDEVEVFSALVATGNYSLGGLWPRGWHRSSLSSPGHPTTTCNGLYPYRRRLGVFYHFAEKPKNVEIFHFDTEWML